MVNQLQILTNRRLLAQLQGGSYSLRKECCCGCPTTLTEASLRAGWLNATGFTYSSFINRINYEAEICCGREPEYTSSSSEGSILSSSSSSSGDKNSYCVYHLKYYYSCDQSKIIGFDVVSSKCVYSEIQSPIIDSCLPTSTSSTSSYGTSSSTEQQSTSTSSEGQGTRCYYDSWIIWDCYNNRIDKAIPYTEYAYPYWAECTDNYEEWWNKDWWNIYPDQFTCEQYIPGLCYYKLGVGFYLDTPGCDLQQGDCPDYGGDSLSRSDLITYWNTAADWNFTKFENAIRDWLAIWDCCEDCFYGSSSSESRSTSSSTSSTSSSSSSGAIEIHVRNLYLNYRCSN